MKSISPTQCGKGSVDTFTTSQRLKRVLALTALFLSEIVAGLLGGAAAAAVFMPMAFAERGYHAYGGEWLLIFLMAALSYRMFHNWLFGKLEE